MQRFNYLFTWCVGVAILFLSSCNNQDICLSNQHAVQIRLLSLYSVAEKDTTLKVSAYGVGLADSVYASQSLSKLFLPLSFENDPDTTSFVVKLNTSTDTIHIIHRKELDFISGDCGYVFKFEIDTVLFSQHTIDSAVVSYPLIKYGEDAVNVKLYIY